MIPEQTSSISTRRRRDWLPAGIVCLVMATLVVFLFAGGALVAIDTSVSFYPLYHLLGVRIRQGDLPLWNPSVLSGAPLLADPQSGWLYLPAMSSFVLLPIWLAAIALSTIHVALAAGGTFLFARRLGFGRWGAAAAAIAYGGSGWFTTRLSCCPADIATAAFLPVALLFVELGLHASSRRRRIAALIGAGFAMAQMLSAWLGQGSYYGFLAIGGYLAYRTLIDGGPAPWRQRLLTLLVSGGVIGVVTGGLAAGGLLPRLEFLQHSNLADGYPIEVAGWKWWQSVERLFSGSSNYGSAIVIPLAVAGLIILRRQAAAPYWGVLIAGAWLFSVRAETPVHRLLYAVLPMFERMQEQLPNRIFMVAYLGLAILAGGAIDRLPQWKPTYGERAVLLVASLAMIVLATMAEVSSLRYLLPLVMTVAVVLAVALLGVGWMRRAGRWLPAILVLAIVADLALFTYQQTATQIDSQTKSRVNLRSYYDPRPASSFLMQATATDPGRFFGIDPSLAREGRNGALLYGRQFFASRTAVLVVNNRAVVLGLEDIQGVDLPMKIARYDDFFTAINGQEQDYHNATILSAAALDSPLINLLNVRYVVIPNDHTADPELDAQLSGFTEVYSNPRIRVLENNRPAPRAWMVHEVQQTQPDETLSLLASGAVDGATTGLIESGNLPEVAPAPSGSDQVSVFRPSPERIEIATESSAPGLLVVSEVTYPAWTATVDGKRVDVLTVDHTLIGVPVPAGQHQVVIRFDSQTATIGNAITGITLLAIAGLFAFFGWDRFRDRRRGQTTGAASGETESSKPPL